jgi:hypothetical protein
MVKDQHPQAAKEAAANVLPGWLDAFNVLLDLDPQQDVTGAHWDGLEIRVQIFKVRAHTPPFRFSSVDLPRWGRTDTRHDTYVVSAHHRTVFARLCYGLAPSSPCALSDIRAILSGGQYGRPEFLGGRADRAVQARCTPRRLRHGCYAPKQGSRIVQ